MGAPKIRKGYQDIRQLEHGEKPDFICGLPARSAARVCLGSRFDYVCCQCGEKVALAPSGQKLLARNPQARTICVPCGLAMIEQNDIRSRRVTDADLLQDLLGGTDN